MHHYWHIKSVSLSSSTFSFHETSKREFVNTLHSKTFISLSDWNGKPSLSAANFPNHWATSIGVTKLNTQLIQIGIEDGTKHPLCKTDTVVVLIVWQLEVPILPSYYLGAKQGRKAML